MIQTTSNTTGSMCRRSGIWECAECGERTFVEAAEDFPPCPRSIKRVVWNYKGRLI